MAFSKIHKNKKIRCHICPHNGKFHGENYESSPCASCSSLGDPAVRAYVPQRIGDIMEDDYDTRADVKSEMLGALALCVRMLLELNERRPFTFKIAMGKIENPYLSYEQLATQLNCTKQNIQYHLAQAIKLYPVLENALIVNERYNPGKKGIKGIANFSSL
jgi:hypothetical protein